MYWITYVHSIPEPEATKQRSTRRQLQKLGTRESAHILVIEDNSDMRTYIRGHLDENYTIVEAENGRTGHGKSYRKPCPILY